MPRTPGLMGIPEDMSTQEGAHEAMTRERYWDAETSQIKLSARLQPGEAGWGTIFHFAPFKAMQENGFC